MRWYEEELSIYMSKQCLIYAFNILECTDTTYTLEIKWRCNWTTPHDINISHKNKKYEFIENIFRSITVNFFNKNLNITGSKLSRISYWISKFWSLIPMLKLLFFYFSDLPANFWTIVLMNHFANKISREKMF